MKTVNDLNVHSQEIGIWFYPNNGILHICKFSLTWNELHNILLGKKQVKNNIYIMNSYRHGERVVKIIKIQMGIAVGW